MKLSFDLKNPRLRVPALIVLIGIGGGFLWFQNIYTPNKQEMAKLQLSCSAKQDTLRTVLALKPQLSSLKKELELAQAKLDSLKSIFPDQKEIPKLIREITGVARASGITTTRFNPLPDVEREYYVENRYNISVTGGYHELAEFFAFLANFPLIINLTSVSISASPEGSGLQGRDNGEEDTFVPSIVSSFELTTFSSKK
ncbi:MAG TPA: type 4a pilus biogenesis protein PilO [Chitinispirillaceae bacterium]|jgi:type IV pilus assembly protein PilO|nr:type 4a pilus biogenesis protein PilO [Chitinispirillaceae bacterium]